MVKETRRTRGDGALYRRSDGLWVGSIENGWTADGKRRRKVVTSKTQAGALEKLRKARREIEVHGQIPTNTGTVGEYLDRWLQDVARPRVAPKTLDGYIVKVKLIKAAIGNVKLDKLTANHVRAMHRHAMSDGRSPTNARAAHTVLRTALVDAQREGLVLRNVCDLVDVPAKAHFDQKPLSADEARRVLLSVVDDPYAARWTLGLLYGVRQGEALGLTWDSVDFAAGTIDLEWQLVRVTWRHGCDAKPCRKRRGADCPRRHLDMPAGREYRELTGAWVLTRPKRQKRRRVPLIPIMAAALDERMNVSRFDPNPYGLVFARPNGQPWLHRDDNLRWHEILKAAGIPERRLHDARHTAATLLLEAGVDAHVIAAILGHSDIVTTRGYQHVDLELARRALETYGRELEG